MDTAVAIIVLLWNVFPYITVSATLCETAISEDLTDSDICLIQNDKKYLECQWTERIVMSKVLVRVCKRDPSKCCQIKRSDVYYDTDVCLTTSIVSAEQSKYSRMIREVLEQCSQQRYCLLQNTPGSAMTQMKTLDVGARRLPAGLTVVYSCEKVHDTFRMSLCEDRRVTSSYIYLEADPMLLNEGNLTCTCDLESSAKTPVDVHVLDVRLRPGNKLSMENILGEYREYDSGYAVYGSVIRFNHYKLSLVFNKLNSYEADRIWINVTARISSVTVNCRGPKATQWASIPRTLSPKPKAWYDNTSLIFLIIGILTACALTGLLGIFVMACRRMKNRGHYDLRRPVHRGEFITLERTCGEPIYSEVKQTPSSGRTPLTIRSQYKDDLCSVRSDYTVPWDDKPATKPRYVSRQDPGYSGPNLGSRHVSGCSGDMELVDMKSHMHKDCFEEKIS